MIENFDERFDYNEDQLIGIGFLNSIIAIFLSYEMTCMLRGYLFTELPFF